MGLFRANAMMRDCGMAKNVERYDKYDLFQDDLFFPEEWGITVKNIGYSRNEANFKWYDRREYFVLHYIVAGKGRYKIGGKEYSLSAGDGFVYLPNTLISYVTDSQDPWTCYWIGVSGKVAENALKSVGIDAQNPIFHYRKDNGLAQEMDSLFELARNKTPFPELIVGGFYRMVGILAGEVRNVSVPKRKAQPIYGFTRYIVNHMAYTITVSELAEYQEVSVSEVYRIFKKNTGMNPHRYIEKVKMDKACEYIQDGDMNFTEIAHSLGYEYTSHFYKVFQRIKGMTPSQYQKKHS